MQIIDDSTPDAALFRAINLAGAPFEHEDADPVLAALRARGWAIRIQGHQRSGELIITLRKPTGVV